MCSISPGTPQPCVVIIGAGMAGLSAAHRLVQCGITNLRILEAMESPGGRIKTCWMGDTVAETGWNLIEGASLANTIYTLAAQERIIKAPLERIEDETALFFTSDGRALDKHVTIKARRLFEHIEQDAIDNLPPPTEPATRAVTNLAHHLESKIEKRLNKLPKHERWDVARVMYGMAAFLRSKLGAGLDQLRPEALEKMDALPGGDVRVSQGLNGLVAPLIRDLPPNAVVYCKPVNCVLWGTAGPGLPRAIVKCCDGENFPADYVIVTVSLGVLKHSAERLFCPALPAYKMEAINTLGFGDLSRVFMQFDTPFWVGGDGGMYLAWSPLDLQQEHSWVKGVTSIETVPGSSRVLMATIAGPDANRMEGDSDCVVADKLVRLMKRFLGLSFLPSPKEILRSSWSRNLYFHGYKTYLKMGSGGGMIETLKTPLPSECGCENIPPIIMFAGEHTDSTHFATLHGSRISGIREADRIVALTKKFHGPPNKGPDCIPCT